MIGAPLAWLRGTDLWRQPVADCVHVVAGRRWVHEALRVAGEAVPVGRKPVGGAAVSGETPLVHGGGGEGLRPVHCAAAAICQFTTSEKKRTCIRPNAENTGTLLLHICPF